VTVVLITRETDYALRILQNLMDGEKRSVGDISQKELIPQQFAYKIAKKLAKAGVCIGVRTNDPCVDIDIFYRNKLSPEQYPLRVVKGADMPTDNGVVSAKKTSLVAAGSLKGLIKTILVCDRLRGVLGTNFVIKTVAAVVGLLIMGFIVLAGVPLGSMWSLYFALYQLIWLAPVYVISKIYI
jgi:hypothetical protein